MLKRFNLRLKILDLVQKARKCFSTSSPSLCRKQHFRCIQNPLIFSPNEFSKWTNKMASTVYL